MAAVANNPYIDKYNEIYVDDKDKFSFTEVSPEEVEKAFHAIKSNAMGSDDIDRKMLELLLPELSEVLTFIINKCLLTSVFPNVWKFANILPIPKNSNPTALTHFRPISILPTISKILEKIVANQINKFLTTKKILPPSQSGFRAHHSTTTALLHVTDEIFKASDSNLNTCLILLDFTKAFDTLNHDILCSKLGYFGFSESSVEFFYNYLQDRHQRVGLRSNFSNFELVKQGVPQGSILGPLLFSIYTADFYTCLSYCNSHQYADDTQIFFSFQIDKLRDSVEKINADLKSISEISEAHNLILNESKTVMLLFGPHNKTIISNGDFHIKLNNVTLNTTEFTKNLGLYLDIGLRFSRHVNYIVQKSYIKLKLLYMHRDFLSVDVKLKLCDSLILSYINYCDVVYWPALTMGDRLSLQRIQNACVRFCYNLRKFDHISNKFLETGWLNLNERYQVHMACLTYNIVKTQCPEYLFTKLVTGDDTHQRPTRFCNLFRVPKHRTALFERGFSYNAVSVFNKIPQNIRDCQHVATFRKHVKTLVLIGREN